MCFVAPGSYKDGDAIMLVTEDGARIKFRVGVLHVSEVSERIIQKNLYVTGYGLVVCLSNTYDTDSTLIAGYHNDKPLPGKLDIVVPGKGKAYFLVPGMYEVGDTVVIVTDTFDKVILTVDSLSIPEEMGTERREGGETSVENCALVGCNLIVYVRNTRNTDDMKNHLN